MIVFEKSAALIRVKIAMQSPEETAINTTAGEDQVFCTGGFRET